jgi:dephospho-CoA kinase
LKARKRLVIITGMPGSGKALASAVARDMGYAVFVCGDVIREETGRRGLPQTPENVGEVMLKIRDEEGLGVVARRLISKMEAEKSKLVLVEGVRSMEEVEEFKKLYDTIIVAIHSSPATRFQRLKARGRSDDPKTWVDFSLRDERELKVGVGKVIALADKMLVNEGTIEQFKENFRKLLLEVAAFE